MMCVLCCLSYQFGAPPNYLQGGEVMMHHHNQGEDEETVDNGAQEGADLASTMRNMSVQET